MLYLFDTEGNDLLEGFGDRGTLTGDGYFYEFFGMDTIYAVANAGGTNTWALDDFFLPEIFRVGDWVDAE